MTDQQADAWGTDTSSGFLNDYVGTVTDSYFATNPKINEGNTLLLHLVTSVDNLDEIAAGSDFKEEAIDNWRENGITQNYSCGSKWITEDGGKTAEHPVRPDSKFHATSMIGKIIDSCKGELEGYGENATDVEGQPIKVNLTGVMDILRERGNPQQASVWNGLTFRFQEIHFDYGINKETGKAMKGTRSMPVEFLGDTTKAKADKPAATSKVAEKAAAARAKAQAAKDAKANGGTGGVDAALDAIGVNGDLAAGVKAALEASDTHDAFMDAALDVEGVPENDALMELVVDDGDNGLWAKKG